MHTNATTLSLCSSLDGLMLFSSWFALGSRKMSQAVEGFGWRAASSPRVRRKAVEWPTMALTLGCYGGWLAITYAYQTLPLPFVLVIGSLLITLHSSLQHEILHGHPTALTPGEQAARHDPAFALDSF